MTRIKRGRSSTSSVISSSSSMTSCSSIRSIIRRSSTMTCASSSCCVKRGSCRMRCSRICIITSVISSRSIKRGSSIEASGRAK